MSHFDRLDYTFDPAPILAEINAHPELWNAHSGRTKDPNSPHRDTDDIWVRFRAFEELKEPKHFGEPHFSEFYPAWDLLPSLKPIISDLIALIRPVSLGGILITRIPAGKKVHVHHDRGGWHAAHNNFKVFAPLATNSLCVNWFEDRPVRMKAGECWRIDNQVDHCVYNDGPTDRVTVIPTFRVEF